ncbi:GNAT family N-acetyltransferase [Umezawaea beigongshangensis]|uniref:GNAT family N-acetyltransferase n=1 Tax=Umezawaea beigongshangensis TaxID=2780383 RepID=UPI0018F25BB4|nr:GNAT family N-acetyltransferase [Umezawaea beigongshangensis]
MSPPVLRAARLELRPLRADDTEDVVRLFAAPALSRYLAADLTDPERARAVVARGLAGTCPEGLGHWAFVLGDELVGLGHLWPSLELPGDVPEIGWYVGVAHQGRGLATEAAAALLDHGLNRLGLPAVWALVHECDAGSLALAAKLGLLDVGSGTHHGDVHRVLVALPGGAGPLHHVELWVPDLPRAEASIGWLLRALGWTEHQRWSRGASWKLGRTYVVVEDSADRRGGHDRTAAGLNHLALHAGSPGDVEALVAESAAHGWRLMFADRHPHAGGPEQYAAYLENADGFEVELVAERMPCPNG